MTTAPPSISTASKNPPPSDSSSQPAATSDPSPTDDQLLSTESTKHPTKFRHWNVNVDDGMFVPSPPLNTTSRSEMTLRPNTTTSSPSMATPTLIQDNLKTTTVSDSSKTAPPSTSWPKPPPGRSFDKQQDFSTTNSDPTSTSPPNIYPPGMFAAPPGFKVESTCNDPSDVTCARSPFYFGRAFCFYGSFTKPLLLVQAASIGALLSGLTLLEDDKLSPSPPFNETAPPSMNPSPAMTSPSPHPTATSDSTALGECPGPPSLSNALSFAYKSQGGSYLLSHSVPFQRLLWLLCLPLWTSADPCKAAFLPIGNVADKHMTIIFLQFSLHGTLLRSVL
jgi:hypothetical protein